MSTETLSIKRFLTRTFNKDNTIPYAWINTEYYTLREEGIKTLKEYFNKSDFIRYMIIVNNIEVTRPQRTMGDMPEWFRPAGVQHCFDGGKHYNCFVFAVYGKDITKGEIEKAIKSFPDSSEVIFLNKESEG